MLTPIRYFENHSSAARKRNTTRNLTHAMCSFMVACGATVGLNCQANAQVETTQVVAWGQNSYGECNIPTTAQSGVTAIAGGSSHTIALKSDGSVLAWGQNDSGQCNIPTAAQSGVTAIAGGWYHTIALKDGAVLAWGDNNYGQCNTPTTAQSEATAIAGGLGHTIALVPFKDCNNNGIDDPIEIAVGCSIDSDLDGRLDQCEYAKGDLDLNGTVDSGDLALVLLNFGEVTWP